MTKGWNYLVWILPGFSRQILTFPAIFIAAFAAISDISRAAAVFSLVSALLFYFISAYSVFSCSTVTVSFPDMADLSRSA